MKFILEHFGSIIAESFLEEGREYFIGRQKDCDFVLAEDSGLSRKHVKIYQSSESGNWLVESASEWGGLYLEGEEVQSVEIENSCFLSLKNYSLKFILEEDSKPESGLVSSKQSSDLASFNPSALEEDLTEDKTRVVNSAQLIYSLYISISGEFSDHVSLNLGDSWVLGRAEECDICVDYSFLTRRHVQFLKKDSKFYVKDLGSANKTLLNEKELPSEQEILLNPNDEIEVADLKIVFEVRNTEHKNLMQNLPAPTANTDSSMEKQAIMAFPKVVLEDSPPEQTEGSSSVPFFKDKKKRLIAVAFLPLLLFAVYFKYEEDKKKQTAIEEEQKSAEIKKKNLEYLLSEARGNYEQGKFEFCIEQIAELHSKAESFQDSPKLLLDCNRGLEYKNAQKVQEELEKQRLETEKKIKELAEGCQKEFDENKIKTVADLNLCAEELFSLDPENSVIASIRNIIEEREMLKQLEEQKRAEYRKFIQGKKALYNKAKKLKDQNKPLKAVSAYKVFLKSARGIASLKKLYETAEQEKEATQKGYDDRLSSLYKSCDSLIESNKMKLAYYDCKEILKFKNHDNKALNSIQKAKQTLQEEIKPLYEKSLWHESFSRVEEAIKIWQEILEKDIKEGYYYEKADFQIEKYK